jgi:hypothetical protein
MRFSSGQAVIVRLSVALLLVSALLAMSAALCFARQERPALMLICFSGAILSVMAAARVPDWTKRSLRHDGTREVVQSAFRPDRNSHRDSSRM